MRQGLSLERLNNITIALRAYSHQESPLVRLFSPDQNTMFLFWFGAVPIHIALFASGPEFVNKPTCVQRSFNHWTKSSGVGVREKGGKARFRDVAAVVMLEARL